MRILLVTTSYPEREDGSEAAGGFVQDFAHTLARYCEVMVVAPAMVAKNGRDDRLNVSRFAVPSLPLSVLSVTRPLDWGRILAVLHGGHRAVMDACESFRPDHILALWALPSGAWARAAGRRYRVPYSTWALGSDIWSLGRIPVIRSVLRRVLKDAHSRFADGYQLAEDVQAISGSTCRFLPSSRQLPMVVKADRAGAPYRLLFLGRWHRNKGVDLLLEALKLLGDGPWSQILEIKIAGGGPMDGAVRAEVGRLCAQGRPVTLLGFQDARQAAELLAWADYLLLPSRIESIPVIFSDALQVGTPIVSTPVGDLPRLLASAAVGVLAERPDAQAYAIALAVAVERKPSEFRAGLTSMAKEFSVEAAALTTLERLSLGPECQ